MADKPMPDNEEGWRKQLTPEQYRVLREKGTEPPFTGEYLHAEADGTFTCAACSNKLFSSDAKFDSGTGWPSFDEALPGAVEHHTDSSHGMVRTEITCARCGSHPRAASATASIRSASSSTRRTEPQDFRSRRTTRSQGPPRSRRGLRALSRRSTPPRCALRTSRACSRAGVQRAGVGARRAAR